MECKNFLWTGFLDVLRNRPPLIVISNKKQQKQFFFSNETTMFPLFHLSRLSGEAFASTKKLQIERKTRHILCIDESSPIVILETSDECYRT